MEAKAGHPGPTTADCKSKGRPSKVGTNGWRATVLSVATGVAGLLIGLGLSVLSLPLQNSNRIAVLEDRLERDREMLRSVHTDVSTLKDWAAEERGRRGREN